jgi:hypothetical protein
MLLKVEVLDGLRLKRIKWNNPKMITSFASLAEYLLPHNKSCQSSNLKLNQAINQNKFGSSVCTLYISSDVSE